MFCKYVLYAICYMLTLYIDVTLFMKVGPAIICYNVETDVLLYDDLLFEMVFFSCSYIAL